MNPADAYAAQVDAVHAQRTRIYDEEQNGDLWADQAPRFALDPRRVLMRTWKPWQVTSSRMMS